MACIISICQSWYNTIIQFEQVIEAHTWIQYLLIFLSISPCSAALFNIQWRFLQLKLSFCTYCQFPLKYFLFIHRLRDMSNSQHHNFLTWKLNEEIIWIINKLIIAENNLLTTPGFEPRTSQSDRGSKLTSLAKGNLVQGVPGQVRQKSWMKLVSDNGRKRILCKSAVGKKQGWF